MLTHRALAVGFLSMLISLALSGCVNQEYITTRPEYAFPQNLIPLCEEQVMLSVSNKGNFASSYASDRGNELLLSPHLLQVPLADNRRIVTNKIKFNVDRSMRIDVLYDNGKRFYETIPNSRTNCNEEGEFIIAYPEDSYYFWASVGNMARELALWTNSDGDLIAQNRWKETHKGIVGGEIKGDAWAVFKHATQEKMESQPNQKLEDAVSQIENLEQCESLSGEYQTNGDAISTDGRLGVRTATDQFFREDIVGVQPVNQVQKPANRLELIQDPSKAVRMNIYGEDGLLASRTLDARAITCEQGKWEYKGDKKMHSAWALMAASGGVYWEDLSLWRDDNGDLLVNGTYKRRGVLLLVPVGNTEGIFVAYPKK